MVDDDNWDNHYVDDEIKKSNDLKNDQISKIVDLYSQQNWDLDINE